ncbi:MAG TPA: hybrid sensor histidine kinase/response regulator, partial [Qipengyuania sp.]|nr:hybrid sensor histidine kinase/response regulator [Qipengyuania sp.]
MSSFADRLAAIDNAPSARLGAALAGAVLASVLLVWIAAGSALIAAAYAGGVAVLVLSLAFSNRFGSQPDEASGGLPDWTVTAAAIDDPRRAIAVTDRANRLVCANASYQRWFASIAPPSELGFAGASADGLALAA